MPFSIDMNTDPSLEEACKLLNVTQERIRQIETKAWRKLRRAKRAPEAF